MIMKKLTFFVTALSVFFFAASCQQENLEPEMSATSVTYTVEVPQVETKAIGDGADVNQLIYEVWRTVVKDDKTLTAGNGTERLYAAEAARESDGKFRFTVDLVQDQNYTILFWAQVKDAGYYNTKDLRNVTFSDGKKLVSNNEARAAFYGIDHIDGANPKASETVELTRPFAQINLGSVPRTEEQNKIYELTADYAFVKVTGAATSFNVATATAGKETTTWAFAKAEDPAEGLTVNATPYDWVAMNYIFVPKNQATVTVDYTIYTNHGEVTNTVLNVPVQMNYRTNIVGNLLTSKTEYAVELDADWGGNDYYGPEFVMEPQKDEEGNYKITNKYELLWLAASVNGTLPGVETKAASSAQTFKGKTFKLSEDVDLENMEWTPIGNSTNNFQGTFDGNGKTVKNLLITGNNSNVGLFGFTTNGEIKNLTVENAKVSGRLGVGVVAGSPYTSKYTDITVTGHIEVNGMAYVGGVGGRNAYADWTNVKVEADETSYVNANSVEDGIAYRTYVGGVVGFNGEGGHSFKNISSNIDVTGSTIDVGGLFGIAHYGNKFESCSCSGNVEITGAAEAADAEEIGGIAGVWNNGGANVTFDKCKFTGTLEANITEGVDLSDNTIVGNPYSKTGTGKLIIDGKEFGIVAEIPAEVDLGEGNTVVLPALKADHKVLVKGNGTLVLAGTSIESAEGAALELASGAAVTLRIDDEVALTGAAQGILVPADATLLVKGAGNLAVVGKAGSGIDGSVEISSLAHITAKGNGDRAFGIGGNGATVVIDNSTIDHVCGGHVQPLFVNDTKYGKSEPEGAPAIGGAKIIIRNNSVVTKADGGSKAAAIGAQYWQSTDIKILNSTIVEANGGNASAGIGGSRYSDDITADNKQVSKVYIEKSKVTATGGQAGAGIGSGYDTHCAANESNAVNDIQIVNSTVTATGGKYAAGIGTGYHAAALTGSIDDASAITATSGEKFYKEEYSQAQNIGYGVVDPDREYAGAVVTFTVAGKVIEAPIKEPVAKVGDTEYFSIDDAIANWTHNTTLTLVADVTLSDVITLKSTEHHILNLSTFTLTAAEKKNAIEITPDGAGTAAKSCLTINADATNPGSINAGSKSCIYYRKTNGINDRLMVTINGGVFDGTISSSSNNGGQACPYFVFNGGVFNKSVNLTKAMLKVTGGIFHGMFSCTGDSTAYRLISGGTFKSWTFMTADAANKFAVGSAKSVYDVGVYVDDNGYLVVGGPVITEFDGRFQAKATNPTKWSSYLQYSSAAANGLYYTNADKAITKHGEANVVLP